MNHIKIKNRIIYVFGFGPLLLATFKRLHQYTANLLAELQIFESI